MQPLSADPALDLDEVVRVGANGTVTSIATNPPSLIIHATQYVAGGERKDDIAVRGEMQNNPKWQDPAERLPKPRAVVSIFGPLRSFDSYRRAGNDTITCVVMDVDDITYLFNPPRETDKKNTQKANTTEKKKSALQEKFQARARKRHASQSLSSPSTSQVQLGKRKDTGSEEEVNERV